MPSSGPHAATCGSVGLRARSRATSSVSATTRSCHLARTPAGLIVRIAQRILALTIGILLNTLNGRPARALAAYDGR
jgi:hypothetical protein